ALILIAVFLITAAGNAINDYFDVEIDAINKPNRPIPSGKINRTHALYFSIVLFIIGTIIAFYIHIICGLIALFNSILLIYYGKTLKQKALIGNIAVGYLTGATVLFGGAVFGIKGMEVLIVLFLLVMLATIAREIVKDIEDIKGDEKQGLKTLPIKIGVKKSANLAALITSIAIVISPIPFLTSMMSIEYLIFILFVNICFIFAIYEIVLKNNPAKSSLIFKIAFVFALLSFVAGI
ncbi:MAG: geranylgeranylglycerol-phosphate geranylgeranyltransferase, partial [Methanosarcinales archaeon]|nr:geranylgeranylglycerol-phosphate geranylgeranyltransferase [Methanosarcinales archaeon]